MWPAIDAERVCTTGLVPAAGICVSASTHTKGLYELCAVNAEGAWFYASVPTDVQITFSDGWAFGPIWLANILKIAAMTPAQDSVCEGIVQGPNGLSVPECGDSGDAAAGPDGGGEQ
jgi:hypothetical protein